MSGKTAVSVLHDAQILLNKICCGVCIHRQFSSSTDTVILPIGKITVNIGEKLERKNTATLEQIHQYFIRPQNVFPVFTKRNVIRCQTRTCLYRLTGLYTVEVFHSSRLQSTYATRHKVYHADLALTQRIVSRGGLGRLVLSRRAGWFGVRVGRHVKC